MNKHVIINTLFLLALTVTARAQVSNDDRHPTLSDSIKADYERWLHGEPQATPSDSGVLQPLPPTLPIAHPEELSSRHPSVSINIMTPRLRTDMRLAYQSHQLEEQQRRIKQEGGLMVGVSPLALASFVLSKIFPERKSKRQKEREKLQRVLDNY